MHRLYYGVLAGCLLSLFLPLLPAFLQIIFPLLLLLAALHRCWLMTGLLGFLCSWHWQLLSHHQAVSQLLAATPAYYEVRIRAVQQDSDSSLLQLELLDSQARGYQLRVRWLQAPALAVGERWRLPLRLKAVSSRQNPGAVNAELSALQQKVIATGYVDRQRPAIKLASSRALRPRLLQQLELAWQGRETVILLRALSSGERDFSPELWQGLRHSGLGHLLVISGLHISLVYGWSLALLLGLGTVCRRRVPLPLALLLSLLPALAYAWLAGFAVPTLRAIVALGLFLTGRLLLRPANAANYWLLLCSTLLLLNPLWAISVSFWLSILAVGMILLFSWYLGPLPQPWRQRLRYWLCFHLLLTASMSLLTAVFFNGLSALALISNLLFIPWCTLLAIPLLLLALLYSLSGLPFATEVWLLPDLALRPLQLWLHWAAQWPVWWSLPELSSTVALLLCGLFLLLLVLRVSYLVWGCFVLTLSLAMLLTPTAGVRLTLLDSGQATVLLLEQRDTKLLYLDIPAPQAEQLVRQQLLPLLQFYRIRQLDAVIWPRLTTEHLPAVALLRQHTAAWPLFSADVLPATSQACAAIEKHELAAKLTLRHWSLPDKDPCSLSISLNGWQLLLPGSLQRLTEQRLLARYPELSADLYLLSDFGRDSANSLALLQQLAPVQLLLAANGAAAHPYPVTAVRQRIALLQLPLYHSGEQGAIVVDFQPGQLKIATWRQRQRPRWTENVTPGAETEIRTR